MVLWWLLCSIFSGGNSGDEVWEGRGICLNFARRKIAHIQQQMKHFLSETARTMISQFHSIIPSISEMKDFSFRD